MSITARAAAHRSSDCELSACLSVVEIKTRDGNMLSRVFISNSESLRSLFLLLVVRLFVCCGLIGRFRLLTLHRVPCLFPGVSPSEQGRSVRISFLHQLRYQTGTRVFVRSGTVDNNLFAFFRQFLQMSFKNIAGDVDRTLDVLGFVSRFGTRIDEDRIA